jgi:hypothetical protein
VTTNYIDPRRVMARIDRMSKPMRALVREYGYVAVSSMIKDGYRDPFELAEILANWRARRQEEWLNTNYVTRKSAQSIAEATAYRISAGSWPKHT